MIWMIIDITYEGTHHTAFLTLSAGIGHEHIKQGMDDGWVTPLMFSINGDRGVLDR